jgi:hypothetical protein
MYLIKQITVQPRQKQRLIIYDGSFFDITLYFMAMQKGWFIEELVYKDFILNGLRIVNSPNMLRQFKNKLPFGLACFSGQNREPMCIEDFDSENSKLYVMDDTEVLYYENYLAGLNA